MKQPKRSESDVLASVRLLLKARGILHFRRNVGKVRNSRGKWVSFGMAGESDIEAIVKKKWKLPGQTFFYLMPVFIETKSLYGKLSPDQLLFRQIVESYGCVYLVIRSAAELNEWLEANT